MLACYLSWAPAAAAEGSYGMPAIFGISDIDAWAPQQLLLVVVVVVVLIFLMLADNCN